MSALVALQALEVRAGTQVLLALPRLALHAGECAALVGESGSGKSLTVQALLGLLPHGLDARGALQFDGRAIVLGSPAHRALAGRGLAWVPQDPLATLHPLQRVGAQLVETLRVLHGLDRTQASTDARALLERVQVPDAAAALRRYPHEFSGGQRQRIAIALALATRPRVLVADEPTSALDARIARDVLRLLDLLRAEDGLAVLLVSHDLPLVATHAQQVLVLQRGEVVEAGATADVLARPSHPYTRELVASGRIAALDGFAAGATASVDAGTATSRADEANGVALVIDTDIDVNVNVNVEGEGEGEVRVEGTPPRRWRDATASVGAHATRVEVIGADAASLEKAGNSAAAGVHADSDPDRPAVARSGAHAGTALQNATPADVDNPVVLEARGLRLRYPRATSDAIDGVDLVLHRGEALAIVGESGSGKSSLGRVLLRLVRRAQGEVRLHHAGGSDELLGLGTRQLRPLRRALGIVFQDPNASLDPRMRVLDLVTEPLRVHARLDRAALRERAAALLVDVGLEASMLDRHPHQFSGGQRQRIAIARALAGDPAVLLCDEAVSALDAHHRHAVLQLLDRLRRERGLAMLFITHDLAAASVLASRIAVMERGRIVETGPTADVLARPRHPHTQALVDASRPASSFAG